MSYVTILQNDNDTTNETKRFAPVATKNRKIKIRYDVDSLTNFPEVVKKLNKKYSRHRNKEKWTSFQNVTNKNTYNKYNCIQMVDTHNKQSCSEIMSTTNTSIKKLDLNNETLIPENFSIFHDF